ncbi:hypothetical protein [Nocardioides sp. AN3]
MTAFAHRFLQLYAPSNRLIARVRTSPPRRRTAGGLLTIALLLAGAAGQLDALAAAGQPQWLEMIAGLASWDSIRIGTLSIHTMVRALIPRRRDRGAGSTSRERGVGRQPSMVRAG